MAIHSRSQERRKEGLSLHDRERPPPYVRFWAKAAANIARGMPGGIIMEQYAAFSRQIGAEVIFVPNLESSSIAEQVAWFKRISDRASCRSGSSWTTNSGLPWAKTRGVSPFWPNAPSTMRTMKQYLDPVRPYRPPLPTSSTLSFQRPLPSVPRLLRQGALLAEHAIRNYHPLDF